MANKKRTNKTLPDEVLTLEVPIDEIVEQQPQSDQLVWVPGENILHYVVTRNGLRVSDRDYPRADEPRAIAEKEFWQKVVNRWPDGTRIEIVQYDKKKHRIW